MNAKLRLLLCIAPLLFSAQGVSAENVTTSNGDATTPSGSAINAIDSAPVSKLIGQDVRNAQDAPFAKIEDLLIDLENGRVVQVLLTGDDLADGGVEVPPQTFDYTTRDRIIRWRGDVEKLKTAPAYAPPGSDRAAVIDHAAEVYRHYGQSPYFTDSEPRSNRPKKPGGVHVHGRKDSSIAPVPLGRPILASELLDLGVRDAMDASVGDIEDVIVDLPEGRVVVVVIGSGGFLGLGDSQSTVPPSALDFSDGDKDDLVLAVSKETLRKAPRYRQGEADRFTDRVYTDDVYRSYDAEPYSKVTAADNTRRNKRDRGRANLTPIDQGNSEQDIAITAAIRKAIRAREGSSVNARNIKIITRDGRVTLRGPVKTAEEKRLIEEIAEREAGSADHVTNQLEVIVRSSPSSAQ